MIYKIKNIFNRTIPEWGKTIKVPSSRRCGIFKTLSIKGASGNNLKSVDVDFPLGRFITVTGVSGSGKSSLINETLLPALKKSLMGQEYIRFLLILLKVLTF